MFVERGTDIHFGTKFWTWAVCGQEVAAPPSQSASPACVASTLEEMHWFSGVIGGKGALGLTCLVLFLHVNTGLLRCVLLFFHWPVA
jgi:hypothetical protein